MDNCYTYYVGIFFNSYLLRSLCLALSTQATEAEHMFGTGAATEPAAESTAGQTRTRSESRSATDATSATDSTELACSTECGATRTCWSSWCRFLLLAAQTGPV